MPAAKIGVPIQMFAIAKPAKEGLIDWEMLRETFVRPAAGVLSDSSTTAITYD